MISLVLACASWGVSAWVGDDMLDVGFDESVKIEMTIIVRLCKIFGLHDLGKFYFGELCEMCACRLFLC